jgi:hypothetical protein
MDSEGTSSSQPSDLAGSEFLETLGDIGRNRIERVVRRGRAWIQTIQRPDCGSFCF